jgi:hypothetical protein
VRTDAEVTKFVNSLLGLKYGTLFAGTSTRAPVLGLRAARGRRCRVTQGCATYTFSDSSTFAGGAGLLFLDFASDVFCRTSVLRAVAQHQRGRQPRP